MTSTKKATLAQINAAIAATVAAHKEVTAAKDVVVGKWTVTYAATAKAVQLGATLDDISTRWTAEGFSFTGRNTVTAFGLASRLASDPVAFLAAEPKREAHAVILTAITSGTPTGKVQEALDTLPAKPTKDDIAAAVAAIDGAKKEAAAEKKARAAAKKAEKELAGEGNEGDADRPATVSEKVLAAIVILAELAKDAGEMSQQEADTLTANWKELVVARKAAKEAEAAA